MYLETGEISLPLKRTKSTTVSIPIFCFGMLYFIYYLKRTYLVASSPLIFNILDYTEWPIYIFIFFYEIIKAKFRIRDLILIFFVGCIFLFGYISAGYAELLKAMMIIVALKNVDFHKLFDVMYRILAVSIALTVLLYLLGLSDAGIQRREANALGYAQANSIGYVLMALILLTIVRKEKVGLWNKILLALLNLAGFILSDSRMGFLLACVALLFSNSRIYALIKKKRFIEFALSVLPAILMMFSLFTAVLYRKNAFVQWLNSLFNERIVMNSYILMTKGISLFGQPIEYHGLTTEAIYNPVTKSWSHFMTIDNAYVCLIIEFGLITTIVFGIIYFKLMQNLFKYGAINIAFVMTIISLYGVTESSIISVYVAFPFVLLLNERLKKLGTRAEYDS